jgi:kynureninase
MSFQLIEKHGNETALVLFGGINYYTGQFFELEKISKAARSVGAKVGFDLAHAAGNVELHLHDWDVDFACWCTYKYLNSGPGAIGGAFIHEKHHNENLPRFAGWWGYDKPDKI